MAFRLDKALAAVLGLPVRNGWLLGKANSITAALTSKSQIARKSQSACNSQSACKIQGTYRTWPTRNGLTVSALVLTGLMTWQLATSIAASAFSLSSPDLMQGRGDALSKLVKASVGPRVEIEGGQIRLASPSSDNSDAPAKAASLLDLTAAWLGSLAGLAMKQLIVDQPTIVLRFDDQSGEQGFSQENLALALLPALDAFSRFKFESLKINDGRIRIVHADGSLEHVSEFNAELQSGTSAQLFTGQGEFVLRGHKLAFNGSLGTLVKGDAAAAGFPLSLQVRSKLLSTRFSGRLSIAEGLQQIGQIELATSSLRNLAAWLGQEMPESKGFGAFQMLSSFKWSGKRMTFEEARLSLDGNLAVGTLAVDLLQPRPAVDGTLAFELLDLSRYDLRSADDGLSANIKRLIATEWLQFADVDLRLSARQLKLGELRTGRLAASVSLTAGMLLADLVELEAFDGLISGQFELEPDPSGVRIALRARLDGNDLLQCSKSLLGKEILSGTGTLSVDLAGRGGGLDPILGALNGVIKLEIPGSGRVAIDLNRLMEIGPDQRISGWRKDLIESSRFENLKAQINFKSGRAYGERFSLNLAGKELVAGGVVDLASQQMDLRLHFGGAKQPASDAPQPGPPAIKLVGTWLAPDIFVE